MIVFDRGVHAFGQRRILEEFTGLDRPADAGVLLENDPAGAQIEMADFGVAHLVVRQTDGAGGSVDQRMRIGPQAFPVGLARRGDGVVLRILPVAPPVENDEDQWSMRHACSRDEFVRLFKVFVIVYCFARAT